MVHVGRSMHTETPQEELEWLVVDAELRAEHARKLTEAGYLALVFAPLETLAEGPTDVQATVRPCGFIMELKGRAQ